MLPDPKWREDAFALYRTAFDGLAGFPKPTTVRGEYLLEELKDALFDLKQGVMEHNEEFVRRATWEIRDILRIVDRMMKEGQEL